jgi:phage tail sheath gpL-like
VKSRRTLAIVVGVAVLVAAAVAVAVGLTAGGGQADAHAVIKTTTEPTAGLGTLVHSHGVTIDLPPNWTNLPTTPAELTAMAQSMSATNPQLAKSITQLSTNQLVDHFAIFAVRARTDPSAPLQDLEIVGAGAGGMTLDTFSLGLKTELAAAGATGVSSTSATMGGLPAVRVDYTLPIKTASGTQLVVAVAFGVIDNGNAASIVFYDPGDGVDMKSIVDSFTFG